MTGSLTSVPPGQNGPTSPDRLAGEAGTPAQPGTSRAGPHWGTVSLIKAPVAAIQRFVAHHLDLGATEVHLYLDAPDPATRAALPQDPRLIVTACDADWWARQKRPRMAAHQLRQAFVATQCYAGANGRLDWLVHIDVDEFLLPHPASNPSDRVARILAALPASHAAVTVQPVELLADPDPAAPARFKTTPRMAGQPKSVLTQLYPTFGGYLRGGYISHLEGKLFLRTGTRGLRVGIHGAFLHKRALPQHALGPELRLGHAHAPDWASFRAHLAFRLDQGSYRNRDAAGFRLGDLLAYLRDTEGEPGLRAFYTEICTVRPALVAGLRDLGMLVEWPQPLVTTPVPARDAAAAGGWP